MPVPEVCPELRHSRPGELNALLRAAPTAVQPRLIPSPPGNRLRRVAPCCAHPPQAHEHRRFIIDRTMPMHSHHVRHAPTRAPAHAKSAAKPRASALPEWDLSDLYPAIDSAEVKQDLDRIQPECRAFEDAYKGKLAALVDGGSGGAALAEAVKRYEALDDLLGRLISYAGLVYSGNTTDPVRTTFYGDVQDRITTASTHTLFFTLELNRIDDAVLERAMQDPALGHYRPWIDDVRKEKPYQLEDRIEQLFHEKSMT